MANETQEPRALSAALSAPTPFAPRGHGLMMHAANRHVERWAPEATAGNVRSMRNLSFVDRMVAPWIETAQRSASLRVFSQYTSTGASQREGAAVSWVFPRPWYQDELDWMAAARKTAAQQPAGESPTMFTTRGTFVAAGSAQPQRPAIAPSPMQMPTALYEYVAPSLSIAQPSMSQPQGVGYGGETIRHDAYSPLVPLAAVQAAELMSRAVAPLVRATPSASAEGAAPTTMGRVSPALRTVLTTMLERATLARPDARVAERAPELVTPPAPRPIDVALPPVGRPAPVVEVASPAAQLADHYAEQHARIADLQRIARVSAEREIALRTEAKSVEQRIEQRVETTQAAQRADAAKAAVVRAEDAQKRATDARTAQQEQARAQQAAVEAERVRIEERVQQRLAERAGQQRLHEHARAEAAEHARTMQAQAAIAATAPVAAPAAPAYQPPAEVSAAIAALPPELKQILAARPERGMAAIAELGEALRTAELIARSTAANQTFEVTRGPRLMMPAGLGGLVSAVERAQVIADRPAQIGMTLPAPIVAAAPVPTRTIAPRPRPEMRMPSLPWLAPAGAAPSPATAPRAMAPTTALGATASAQPAALTHVAWADRWLARFAGASPRTLDVLQAGAAATPEQRFEALAGAAPESVFIRPIFDTEQVPRPAMRIEAQPSFPSQTQQPAVAQPVLRTSPQPVERFDDNAETPDDVFAQIAAAAAGARTTTRAPAAEVFNVTPAVAPSPAPTAVEIARMTPADAVAYAAPSAPGAGLAAQLASSPFATALRHVMPLAAASSFDVRALFGGGLTATYLAGLLAPTAEEHEIATLASPAWASFQPAALAAAEAATQREAPELDLTYVAPDAARPVEPTAAAIERGEAPSLAAAQAPAQAETALPAAYAQPLSTLRTALLSWQVDPAKPSFADAPTVVTEASTPVTSAAARAMSQSMSLPLLGGATAPLETGASSFGAPGMIAERAHSWSVAQERSASDLAFDFVPPELVLAARVYGLGPAEAAQAMRLAIAGPGQLAAMASTVDRTFVQAMAIATDRRGDQAAATPGQRASYAPAQVTTAYPVVSPIAAPGATPASVEAEIAAAIGPTRADSLPSAAFGVERRAPRGAFLWPSATVAALGLSAAPPDGQQSMSVAALELLAAQAVAEIGTYAALFERPTLAAEEAIIAAGGDATSAVARALPSYATPAAGAAASAGGAPSLAEPGEDDVLTAAAALVPTTRRARFDALYIALAQSPSGKSWSPAARAARALALAGRSDDTPMSAYERAATAWDVLPVVYATDGMTIAEIDAATATGTLPGVARDLRAAGRARGGDIDMPTVARPGLSTLTARAGEALGSYVAPSTGEMATAVMRSESMSSRELPVAQRAPTAAQEMVQTGRPSGRFGGGEVEIPAWFEAAAKKMLDDRSGSTSSDGGFSLADLTLITAAPASHIAASTKAPHAAAQAPAAASAGEKATPGEPIDVEKIANEVYHQILVLMDTARARNGEPYL